MNTSREAFQALSQEIQSDLDAAAKRVAELQAWASDEPEGIEMYAVAFLLQGLYAAIEAILQRSVKLFDGPLPQGEDWHIQLLNAAAQEVTGRPVILPQHDTVDELRRFRHFAHKGYSRELDPALLHGVIQSVNTSWTEIRGHLERFHAFVNECVQATE